MVISIKSHSIVWVFFCSRCWNLIEQNKVSYENCYTAGFLGAFWAFSGWTLISVHLPRKTHKARFLAFTSSHYARCLAWFCYFPRPPLPIIPHQTIKWSSSFAPTVPAYYAWICPTSFPPTLQEDASSTDLLVYINECLFPVVRAFYIKLSLCAIRKL